MSDQKQQHMTRRKNCRSNLSLSSFATSKALHPKSSSLSLIEQIAGHQGVDAAMYCVCSARRCGECARRVCWICTWISVGDDFDKGIAFKMGQTHVHALLSHLLEQIILGALRPDIIISHHLSLEEAAEGYKIFNYKEQECRKVILRPDY